MDKKSENSGLADVYRTMVHIEQIAKASLFHLEFGVNLGLQLQKLEDPRHCIVKMSSPNVHWPTGLMFKMGQKIIDACKLITLDYSAGLLWSMIQQQQN